MSDDSRRLRVLLVCTHNSACSQMAEGFLRALAGDRFEVKSAGTERTSVHPLAIPAMAERGIDISRHTSKLLVGLMQEPWDYNVDHCARLCHSPTVAALVEALGSGAMTNSMDDIVTHARSVLVIGSNTTEQHPVFGMRLRRAAKDRGLPIIVADPRRTPIVEAAALHLPLRPDTDIALLNGLAHVLIASVSPHAARRCFGSAGWPMGVPLGPAPCVVPTRGACHGQRTPTPR